MHRIIDVGRQAWPSCGRFGVPVLALVALMLALPTVASAATQTLTVSKKGTGTGTVTSSPAGIECGATCAAPFTEGSTVMLTGVPGANTAAVVWSGCASVNLENECKVTMSAAKAVTATFNLLERPLTVSKKGTGTGTVTSSPTGIECGATCSASFVKETVVTLTGTSNPGTEPVAWSGCGSVTAENKCVVTMSTAKTVTAVFNLPSFQLTVNKAGTGAGTVTSSPAGIECGATCAAPFAEKSTVTLTALAGANTEAKAQWSGCSSVDGENKCLVTMDKAKSVTATFKLLSRQLTVKKAGAGTGTVTSSPAGISCGATCSTSFEHGTPVALSGSPGPNTDSTVKWTGCDSVNGEGKCLVTMSAAREVTATFDVVKLQLSVAEVGTGTGTVTSSPAGIVCGATCSAGFAYKSEVALEGTPGLHAKAVKWSGCKEVLAGKCMVTMDAAKTVLATFDLETQYLEHVITVQRKGTGTGTVTSSPTGIECGADCSETYLHKTALTLTPTPDPGSTFDHWSGGGCAAYTGACQTSVNSSRLVRAYFVAVGQRTLTVARAGAGSGVVTSKPAGIECGGTCNAEFNASVSFNTPTKVVLRAAPNSGSTFSGWSGACSGTALACKVFMNEARNVTASFARAGGPGPSPGRLSLGGFAKVKGGKARLHLFCSGQSACEGTLKLVAKIRNAAGQVKGLVIASLPYSVNAGVSATRQARLSSRGLGLLRGGEGRLKVRVTGSGVAGRFVRLAL